MVSFLSSTLRVTLTFSARRSRARFPGKKFASLFQLGVLDEFRESHEKFDDDENSETSMTAVMPGYLAMTTAGDQCRRSLDFDGVWQRLCGRRTVCLPVTRRPQIVFQPVCVECCMLQLAACKCEVHGLHGRLQMRTSVALGANFTASF